MVFLKISLKEENHGKTSRTNEDRTRTQRLQPSHDPSIPALHPELRQVFMRPPSEMGETEVRQFMLHLAQDRKVSASCKAACQCLNLDRLPCAVRKSSNTFPTAEDAKTLRESPHHAGTFSPSLRRSICEVQSYPRPVAYGAGHESLRSLCSQTRRPLSQRMSRYPRRVMK